MRTGRGPKAIYLLCIWGERRQVAVLHVALELYLNPERLRHQQWRADWKLVKQGAKPALSCVLCLHSVIIGLCNANTMVSGTKESRISKSCFFNMNGRVAHAHVTGSLRQVATVISEMILLSSSDFVCVQHALVVMALLGRMPTSVPTFLLSMIYKAFISS